MARGRYKVGEGIVGRVFETGEPIIVPNIGKEPLFLNRTGARIDKNNISFLCVPIKLNEEILGVLSVDRIFDESISFEEDLRVLGVVSVLIAQAIKLYETFEKERSRREELEQEIKDRYQFHNLVFRRQRTCLLRCLKEMFIRGFRIPKSPFGKPYRTWRRRGSLRLSSNATSINQRLQKSLASQGDSLATASKNTI